jgi:hypothetical protein
MSRLLADLRYALRQLRRGPGFAATAILTLALGVTANVIVFGVIDGLFFRATFPHQRKRTQPSAPKAPPPETASFRCETAGLPRTPAPA